MTVTYVKCCAEKVKKKKFGIQVGFDFMYTSIPLSHSDLHLAEDWKVS